MCNFFDGVNNNRTSITASQYFLLCRHSNIAFMHDCQIEDEMFGISMMTYQNTVIYHNIFLNSPIVLVSEMHLLNLLLIVPHILNCLIQRMYLLVRDMPDCFGYSNI